MGVRSGGWCIGCSWALMTALFALGVMSLTWMALVATLVALEKVGPSPRAARVATVTVLAALTFGVLSAPRDVGSPADSDASPSHYLPPGPVRRRPLPLEGQALAGAIPA